MFAPVGLTPSDTLTGVFLLSPRVERGSGEQADWQSGASRGVWLRGWQENDKALTRLCPVL